MVTMAKTTTAQTGRKPTTPAPVPASVGRNGRMGLPKHTECTRNPDEGWGGCGWQFVTPQSRMNCRHKSACDKRIAGKYLGSEQYVRHLAQYGREPSEAALKIMKPTARKARKPATAKTAAPSAPPAAVAPSPAPKPATPVTPAPVTPAPKPAPPAAPKPATPSVLGGLTR